MNSRKKYFVTVAACLTFFISSAQVLDSVSSVITHDTASESETNSSSDENYQFKELTGPGKIDTRNVSDADLKKIKSDKDYWYVNTVPPRNRQKSTSPGVNQKGEKEADDQPRGVFNIGWLNTVFWILLIAGFVALLTWFLSTANIRLFRKKAKNEEEAQEDAVTDIFHLDFDRDIQKAIDARDYTLAVRLMYLQTLRVLSDRNLINYSHEKTNSDYLFQLASTAYYKPFFRLTRSFDYIWYGQFPLSEDSFTAIRNDFTSFKQQLSR
ncbi:MAG: DUF4129 domain-containing protein [Flavisolibacter sp.]